MAIMTTRSLPDAALAAVRALFDMGVLEQNQSLYYQQLGYRDYTPDKVDEQGNSWSAPGRGILTVEGQEYGDNNLYNNYPVQVTLRKYTSKLQVSEEDLHWLKQALNANKIQEIKSYVADAVYALNANVNVDGCKLFYLGFGTTFFTGGDGVSLFNKAHTIKGPTNASTILNNIFPVGDTHREFSAQALIDAVNIMDRFPSNNGEEMRRCRKIRVICAKENAPEVWKAIKSSYGPQTANLGLSAASEDSFGSRGVTIDYTVGEDIPYAYRDYWFVIDMERANQMLLMDWGWKPRLNDQWEYRNGTYFNLGSVYFGPRALSWQFGFGSKGDNSVVA